MIVVFYEAMLEFCRYRETAEAATYDPVAAPGSWAFFMLKDLAAASGSATAYVIDAIGERDTSGECDEVLGNSILTEVCSNVEPEISAEFMKFAKESAVIQRLAKHVFWPGLTLEGRNIFDKIYGEADLVRKRYNG